jgi:2-dehydropantoate 2-reductase
MRVCVFGAGSVGGLIGGRLADAGHQVGLIARGAHLEAIRNNGLTVESGGRTIKVRPRASDRPQDLGPQDVVIVAVKGPALPDVVRAVSPLLEAETAVVFAMNGIPWWFFHGIGGPHDGRTLSSIDPDGALSRGIETRRIIGCVVHVGCSVPEPGFIRHASGNLFIIGEAVGGESPRVRKLADAFNTAGLKTEISPRIQQDIWMKFLGNMSMGPISALSGSTLLEMCQDPHGRKVCRDMIEEAIAVGAKFGLDPGMTVEQRIDLGAQLGNFKTSMLQDMEKSRPLEIDTFLGAPIEMARLVGVPMPVTETVHALIVLKARLAGLYPGLSE